MTIPAPQNAVGVGDAFRSWSESPFGYPLPLQDGRVVSIPAPSASLSSTFARFLGQPAWAPSLAERSYAEVYAHTHARVAALRNAHRGPGELAILVKAVAFGIVADPSINAAAFRSPAPTVAVNYGALVTLRAVIFNALANPQCYPEFDADKEDRGRALCPDPNERGAATRTAAFVDGPIAPIRQFIAQLLFADVVRFLFAHELGHHYRKHFTLCTSRAGLFERRTCETKGAFAHSHAIECDADRFAVIASLIGPASSETMDLVVFRVRMWCTAVTLLFLVFDTEALPWDEDNATHPHPLIRWMMLKLFAFEVFGVTRSEQLWIAHQQSIMDLASILQVVGLPQYTQLQNVITQREQFETVFWRTFSHWRTFTETFKRDLD